MHAYDYVLGDAINCWRLLRTDGVLIFHDYDCVADTTRAVDDFTSRYGAAIVEAVSSLAVVRKVSETGGRQGLIGRELERLKLDLREREIQFGGAQLECNTLREQIRAIEHSLGWRTLDRWRRLRNWLAPAGTRRRRLYEHTRNLLVRMR